MEIISAGKYLKCPILFSNWNNSSNAGVWYVNLNNNRNNSNNNVGFRDSYSPNDLQRYIGNNRECLSGSEDRNSSDLHDLVGIMQLLLIGIILIITQSWCLYFLFLLVILISSICSKGRSKK
jgi:hypothetical protein